MSAVDLNDQEWGQVMSILSDAPWKIANPLLMRIGEQLRANAMQKHTPNPQYDPAKNGNSQEARDGQ
jgi:hypothetical protein